MSDEMMVVDIPEALNRAMGDVEFLKMMLEELYRTIPDYATRFQNHLKAEDLESLGQDAHQFKGAAANLGAKPLAHAAFQLEQIGKSGQIKDADEAYSRLERAMAEFNQYIEQIDWAVISAD